MMLREGRRFRSGLDEDKDMRVDERTRLNLAQAEREGFTEHAKGGLKLISEALECRPGCSVLEITLSWAWPYMGSFMFQSLMPQGRQPK